MMDLCACLSPHGKDLRKRKKWTYREGNPMEGMVLKVKKGVMCQVQVTWLAFDFGTRRKEEDGVQLW